MVKANRMFFVARDLEEKNDIDAHISYAERLVEKYRWEDDVKNDFHALLGEIKAKQHDDKLNLSVVGEFSTGKSTFINAILRCELLASSAMQGTTVASTVIEYSDKYSLKLVYNNGDEKKYDVSSLEELQEKIVCFSTDSETGKKLDKLVVGMPSEPLKQGIRVIDTPGTNALETWHEDVTVKTINEMSDVSIVLIDATKPLPETLCMFIDENLGNVLDKCVFVATKIDIVREREREQVLNYIKMKLKQLFEIEEPLVLPYVSVAVVNNMNNVGEDKWGINISEESEKKIMMHMAHQRVFSQSKRITGLIESAYKSISEQMETVLKKHESELEKLINTQNTDVTDFVLAQKKKRLKAFNLIVNNKKPEYVNEFYSMSLAGQNRITENIDRISDTETLKNYIAYKLGDDCAREAMQILNSVENSYYQVVKWFNIQMEVFRTEFEENYPNMRSLGIVVPDKRYVLPKTATEKQNFDIAYAVRQIAEEIGQGNVTEVKSRFVGNLAGMQQSQVFRMQLTQIKTNVKKRLGEAMGKYFDDTVKIAVDVFDKYTAQIRVCIAKGIDGYIDGYRGVVDRRVNEEVDKRQLVERQMQSIRLDMKDLERRKSKLSLIGEKVSSLMREETIG